MTITLNSYYLHALATLLFVVGVLWAAAERGDFDMGAPIRAFPIVVAYCLYWILFLALTR